MADPTRVFRRFLVTREVNGTTRVEWELDRRFRDPRPHTFTLQVAPSSAPGEGTWRDVGTPAENVFFLGDDEKREFGKTLDHHWRVVLDTPEGAYESPAVSAVDGLDHRDWRLAREMMRQHRKRGAKFTGTAGFLFKRKRYGDPCATCLDPATNEPTRRDCPECFGTGVAAAYHAAVEGLHADMGLEDSREELDDVRVAGTVKPVVIRATFFGFPLVNAKDVWCESRSGRRWFVERVSQTAAVRSYPIQADAELRLAPFADPVYDVPREGS